MIMSKNFSQKGFSLFELLVYIAVLSVVSLTIVGIFIYITKGRGQSESKSEVNSNLRFAVEKITQDLRYASSVATPATASASSTTLVFDSGGSTITYCVAEGALRRQIGGSCDQNSATITSEAVTISGPVFTRFENTNAVLGKTVVSIKINLTASYNSTSPDWDYTETKTTTMSLR